MDFDIAVVRVGLAGKQRLDLQSVGFLPELAQRRFRFPDGRLVALLLAKLGEGDRVVALAGDAVEVSKRSLELLALAHQCLRAALIVPEVRGLSLAVERF